jgi:hypothetical protein
MIGLFERYPGLEVELVAVPRFVSILNREAEISIHLERPAADMLVTRKLTDYRLALYASQAYLTGTAAAESRRPGPACVDRLCRRSAVQPGTDVPQQFLPQPARGIPQHQRDRPAAGGALGPGDCCVALLYGGVGSGSAVAAGGAH